MNLNFTVSLEDIGIGLELSGNSESERQEVMDFLVHVDESVADYEFSQELIYRLVLSIAEDSEVRGWKPVALPEGRAATFSQLYETLSHMPEDELIALVANAMMVKREREAEAVKDEPVMCARPGCGHSERVHALGGQAPCLAGSLCACPMFKVEWPLPLSTMCTCGHSLNWHREGHDEGQGCVSKLYGQDNDCPCDKFKEEA